MTASSIAQILLRLFSLNWLLLGIVHSCQLAIMIPNIGGGEGYAIALVQLILYIVAAAIAWLAAPKISKLVSKNNDRELNLKGITSYQLYSTAFISLGLYFTLSSFSSVFSWIHFFAINRSESYGFHHGEAPSYYELTESLLTVIAGITVIFTAHVWARKLVRVEERESVKYK